MVGSLNALTADADTLERILEDTVFSSRAHLEVQRQQAERKLTQTRQANLNLAEELTAAAALRLRISEAEAELARISRRRRGCLGLGG